jgi:hypothetical protein
LRPWAENQKRFHLDSRRVSIAGITDHPDASWMSQVARHATLELEELGYLQGCRYFCGVAMPSSALNSRRPWRQGV